MYGVGGTETTYLGWEVRDSVGRAIDADNAVDISFRLVNGPGGGEYVSPTTRRTDPNGQTYVSLGSGTRSGIVQVVAEVFYGGNTIQSSPVRIVIDGGFPVQERYTIAAPYYNFAAMNWVNRTLPVTVLVGDVYSNPVAENTAVYFRSGAGVVQPRVYTSTNGQGSVDLISGNPRPFGFYAAPAPLDTGYHYLVGRTIGQNGATVTDSILILWSGVSTVKNLNPVTFDIANGGSQVVHVLRVRPVPSPAAVGHRDRDPGIGAAAARSEHADEPGAGQLRRRRTYHAARLSVPRRPGRLTSRSS